MGEDSGGRANGDEFESDPDEFKQNTANSSSQNVAALANRIRFYAPDAKGPFVVYFRGKDGQSVNQVTLSKKLYAKYKTIIEIRKIFSDKVKVILTGINEANVLPLDKDFSQFRVYIQAKEVEVDGVVILDLDEPEEIIKNGVGKLREAVNAEIKVLDVFRMRKKKVTEVFSAGGASSSGAPPLERKVDWVPARAVRVTFQGNILPDFIAAEGLVITVHGYSDKVMYCSKCLRYGHTVKFCGNKSRCNKCGLVHEDGKTVCSQTGFKCPNCNETFPQAQHVCKARALHAEKSLKNAKVRHNVSYSQIVKGPHGSKRSLFESENPFEAISGMEDDMSDSDSDFPTVAESLDNKVKRRVKRPKSAFDVTRLTQKKFHRKKVAEQEERLMEEKGKAKQMKSQTSRARIKIKKKSSEESEPKGWKKVVLKLLAAFDVESDILELLEVIVFPIVERFLPKLLGSFLQEEEEEEEEDA
ncbi:uncharacterized protein LOC129786314 [Lutzomyia longipalpis]|uniref:uncharacterized protein LOC129786314 n=1 Tax=Lutzomyia longipalpis TaxID=7200 RepID=UPI00248356A7|nr:uncharacterized protein LOC129786314 [Lutzomyia longipalpis]